jgi:hypothetical protein
VYYMLEGFEISNHLQNVLFYVPWGLSFHLFRDWSVFKNVVLCNSERYVLQHVGLIVLGVVYSEERYGLFLFLVRHVSNA